MFNVSETVQKPNQPTINRETITNDVYALDMNIVDTYDIQELYNAMGWHGPIITSTISNTDLHTTVICFSVKELNKLERYYTNYVREDDLTKIDTSCHF